MTRVVTDPAAGVSDRRAAALVTVAFDTISRRYVEDRHQIAAALLDADGGVHVGLHLDAMVGRAAVCAEAGALSAVRLVTGAPLLMIAAVRYPKPSESGGARIVPPCGLCRELLLDHGPGLHVPVPAHGGTVRLVALSQLLPAKYVGTKWPAPVLPSAEFLTEETS
ncbi:cytidine deaminase [Streptomyces sp. NBC_01237]|uniref:cytidine deaminase n=1 Tax=Streptomyces sp. NBC_01237 TaxID=2903790 RepID=UPI002DD7C495|nr:cytidine deaminase [Streptomyces sp. NBC_01237]WRZ77226.1 cytidine deaminase [Streptomyces sp. NBC_01237]